ncbi:unnamed protein product [Lathyrus sativus]|nr:unnamed protein product [Lathyrus sativus]
MDNNIARRPKWKKELIEEKLTFSHLQFNVGKENLSIFDKVFVGEFSKAGNTYNLQDAMHAQGYFNIKVTPMGGKFMLA